MNRIVESHELLKLFHQLDKRIISEIYGYNLPPKKFNLVAVGGTVLGVLGLKPKSKDMANFEELKKLYVTLGIKPVNWWQIWRY